MVSWRAIGRPSGTAAAFRTCVDGEQLVPLTTTVRVANTEEKSDQPARRGDDRDQEQSDEQRCSRRIRRS